MGAMRCTDGRAVSMENLFFVIRQGKTANATYSTIQAAQADQAVTENIGRFFQVCFNFIVISFVLYVLVTVYDRLTTKPAPPAPAPVPPPAPERPCPYCKKAIDQSASRCPYCTSQVEPQ